MAATVELAERNGLAASPTNTANVTNINFGSTAAANLDPDTYPISIATAPRSFEKWLRVSVTNMGGSNIIDNIRVWLSSLGGGYKTGENIMCNLTTSPVLYSAAAYPTNGPVNTVSAVAVRSIPTSEPEQANIGIGGSLSGQITSAPAFSDFIVLQLQVSASTPAGAVNQKVITIEWDEQ